MRSTLLVILLSGSLALGGEPDVFTPDPNIVGQITTALLDSNIDHLTPHTILTPETIQGPGKAFPYYLQSVAYLGTIKRGTERVVLATAFFIGSSAENDENPPPRSHGYLLCLSTHFRLISHCSLDFPNVELNGTKLLRQKQAIADFAASDTATRQRGFVINRSHFLPYPFADRLPDPAATDPKKQP